MSLFNDGSQSFVIPVRKVNQLFVLLKSKESYWILSLVEEALMSGSDSVLDFASHILFLPSYCQSTKLSWKRVPLPSSTHWTCKFPNLGISPLMFPSLTSETAMIPELSQPNRKFFLRCTSQMAPTGPCPGLGNSRTCLFLLRKHAHLSLAAYSWRTSPSLPYTHPPPTLWQIEVSVKTGNFDIILELIRH